MGVDDWATHQRDQVTALHDTGEFLAEFRARLDGLSQQVSRRQMRETILLYDLVALRPLATARAPYTAITVYMAP